MRWVRAQLDADRSGYLAPQDPHRAIAPGTSPALPEYRYPFNTAKKQPKRGCKPLFGGFDDQNIEHRPVYRALVGPLDISLTCYHVINKSELLLVPETGTMKK